jgi:hypothetical protein
MALVEGEYFVNRLEGTGLDSDHRACTRGKLFNVSRVQELFIPAVTRTSPRILATISAPAETSPDSFL